MKVNEQETNVTPTPLREPALVGESGKRNETHLKKRTGGGEEIMPD